MALDDRAHVEAVAIIQGLVAGDPSALLAAEVFLRERHPAPEVYMSAMRSMAAIVDAKG